MGRARPEAAAMPAPPAGTSLGTAATLREREGGGTAGVGRKGAGTNRLKCGAKEEREK